VAALAMGVYVRVIPAGARATSKALEDELRSGTAQ
jgi:hypothetical protein